MLKCWNQPIKPLFVSFFSIKISSLFDFNIFAEKYFHLWISMRGKNLKTRKNLPESSEDSQSS